MSFHEHASSAEILQPAIPTELVVLAAMANRWEPGQFFGVPPGWRAMCAYLATAWARERT